MLSAAALHIFVNFILDFFALDLLRVNLTAKDWKCLHYVIKDELVIDLRFRCEVRYRFSIEIEFFDGILIECAASIGI